MSGYEKIGTASLTIVPDFDEFVKKLYAELKSVRAEFEIPVKADLGEFLRDIESVRQKAERDDVKLKVGANVAKAREEIERFKATHSAEELSVHVEAKTSEALAKINALRAEAGLRNAEMQIDVRAETSRALAEINALRAASGLRPISLKVEDSDVRKSRQEVDGLSGAIDDLTKAIGRNQRIGARSGLTVTQFGAISAAVIGLTADLAGLVGMAGAAAGALASIGAGLGVGLSGIGAALSALKSQSSSSGATAVAKQAQEIADSQHAVEQAQRRVRDATQSATDAYKAQGEAIRDAGRELRDLNDQLKDAELSQEGAAISAARAEERYQETLAKYRRGQASGLDLQEADFNRRSAQQRLREAQSDLIDQREDTGKANQLGISGNPKVVAANKAVRDSTEAQSDAQYELAKAVRELEAAQRGTGGAADKFAEAMEKLSPNAQQFIKTLRELGGAWSQVRLQTQDALFDGTSETLKQLATNQLPETREGLVSMARLANGVVRQSLADLDAQFTANANNGDFQRFLGSVEASFQGLPNFVTGLTNAVVNMTTIAGPAMSGLFSAIGTGASNSSGTFGSLAAHLEEQVTRAFEALPGFMRDMEGPLTAGMDFIAKAFSSFGGILRDNAPEIQRFIEALSDDLLPVIQSLSPYLGLALETLTAVIDLLGGVPSETAMALAMIFLGKQAISVLGSLNSFRKGAAELASSVGDSLQSGWNRASAGMVSLRDRVGDMTVTARENMRSFSTSWSGTMGDLDSKATAGATGVSKVTRAMDGIKGVGDKAKSALSGLAGFIGPGGAFMAAFAAAAFVIGEVISAQNKAAQAAENATKATAAQEQAQRKLSDALAASQGQVTPEVRSSVSQQIENLRTKAKNDKDAAPGWAESAYTQSIKWLNLGIHDGANQDAVNNVDRSLAGISGDSLLQMLDKSGFSNDEMAQRLTGSNVDFESLTKRIKGLGDGGEAAAKKLAELRRNFVETQDRAKTLTPGLGAVSDAMKVLADNASTAEDRSRALSSILDQLAGNKPSQAKALQGYGDAIRSASDAIAQLDKTKGSGSQLLLEDGGLNTENANASAIFSQFDKIKKSLTDLSGAGNLSAEKFDQTITGMRQQLRDFGLSAEQANAVLEKSFGLGAAGRTALVTLKLDGAGQVEQKLATISTLLEGNKDRTITVDANVATDGVRAELSRLNGVVVKELPNHTFQIRAENSEALASINETIARNNFLNSQSPEVRARLNTSEFIKQFNETWESITKLDQSKANPEVNALIDKFKAGSEFTKADIETLNKLRANPTIDADTKSAIDKLAELKRQAAAGMDVPLRLRSTVTLNGQEIPVSQLTDEQRRQVLDIAYGSGTIKRPAAGALPPTPGASGTALGRSGGGPVWGKGTATSDSIDARLSDGEYVQRAASHAYYGTPFMDAINGQRIPREALPGFFTGGAAGTTYGMPKGTQISYGQSDKFPEWVRALEAQFGVQASTYGGHQESNRNEAGYAPNPNGLNRGIDFSGSTESLQKFAEFLLSIAPSVSTLEQIIWQNPNTGQKIGWSGRSDVSNTSYFSSDYGGHTKHVHLRASGPVGALKPETLVDSTGMAPIATPGTAGGSSTTGAGSTTSSTTTSITKPQLNTSGLSFDGGLARLGEIAGNSIFPAGSVLNPSGYDATKVPGGGVNALNPAPATGPGMPLPIQQPKSIFTPGSGVAGANGLNSIGLAEYTGITPGAALGRAGSILGGGILAFFGLENSILSSSNPYNQAIQKGVAEGWRAWGPNVSQTTTTTTPNVGTGDPSDPKTTALLNGTKPGTSGGGSIPLVQNPDGTWTSTSPEWAKLIKRESGGRASVVQGIRDANSGGNEASGLFQIAKGTWISNGGAAFAPTAGQATPQQQAEIAARIFNKSGGSPWGAGLAGRETNEGLKAGIQGFASGGFVSGPGTGTSDSIDARLSNGEHVTNAASTAQAPNALAVINSGPDGAKRVEQSIMKPAPSATNVAQQLAPELPGVIGQGKGSNANGSSPVGAVAQGLASWGGSVLDQGVGAATSAAASAAGGAAGAPGAGEALSFAAGGAKLGMGLLAGGVQKFTGILGGGLGLSGNETANLLQMTQIGKNTGIDGAPVQGAPTPQQSTSSGQNGGVQFNAPVTVASPEALIGQVELKEQQQSQAALASASK